QGTVIPVSLPGTAAGSFSVASTTRLWGLEANVIRNLTHGCHFSADLLMGFRYLDMEEDLNMFQTTTVLAPGSLSFPNASGFPTPVAPGGIVSIFDGFATSNKFYGGQIGGRAEGKWGIWFANMEAKVALGSNHEVVNIGG